MRRVKIFTTLSLLMLSIALLGVGVYAATASKVDLGVGGQISIPANITDISVIGYIGDADLDDDGIIDAQTTATEDYNSESDSGNWSFEEGDLVFDAEGKEELNKVNNVVLTLKVTNQSTFAKNIYFVVGNAVNNLPNETIDIKFYCGGTEVSSSSPAQLAEALGSVKVLKVVFQLKQFLDDETDFGFDYVLNVLDARTN